MNPKKIKAVSEYPRPQNAKKVRSFCGLASYYRKFIKDFARISYPLNKLKGEKKKFIWEKDEKEAYQKMKKVLCEEPVLIAPDLTKPFLLTTDALDYALGAVLSQGKLGSDRPCGYASRVLKGPEFRYSTYDRELLAVEWGIKEFRHYLYGRKFMVITDHEPLQHFH